MSKMTIFKCDICDKEYTLVDNGGHVVPVGWLEIKGKKVEISKGVEHNDPKKMFENWSSIHFCSDKCFKSRFIKESDNE